ncbi:MAG: cytochrome P450 [Castellaniella sp.]|uniref:cytochrome P450 n=1 Tax=Castellaniella sp. TaxID=1955812 RepID=UPI0012204550|nr:cytochrome P450 [Castellaniella sp.]TAN26649.1 MAG: cytochrome P450 [Castellaniella sp.]
MTDEFVFDWDPRSDAVQRDQIAAYDHMRRVCPVARSRYGYTSFFKHADVLRALIDTETFSNVVSARHPSVPNGMDPPQHTRFRRVIDDYFSVGRMRDFEPSCQALAEDLTFAWLRSDDADFMTGFAWEFAVQVQCRFMGWPAKLHGPLRKWMLKNHAATYAIDSHAMGMVAREFDGYVADLLDERRRAKTSAPPDVTTRLLNETVDGQPLSGEQISSIVRNWTVGEVSTIAAALGILAQYLAVRPALQQRLREQPSMIPPAVDEILRIHGPLVMSRRRVTRAVTVRGRLLAPDERVALIWLSANRDEDVFGDPDEFRLDRDPALSLLYGSGPHACPGAPLARLELQTAVSALLQATRSLALAPGCVPVRATFPASGYARLRLRAETSSRDTPMASDTLTPSCPMDTPA